MCQSLTGTEQANVCLRGFSCELHSYLLAYLVIVITLAIKLILKSLLKFHQKNANHCNDDVTKPDIDAVGIHCRCNGRLFRSEVRPSVRLSSYFV